MNRHIVAFIPVRGGSKGIPLKNIKPFCGKPLAYWVIAAANLCQLVDKIYVSTDSDVIGGEVESFAFKNVEVISRSPHTAGDTASTESAMLEFATTHEFTDILLIQATSPLLNAVHLTAGIEKYLSSASDSLLSVVRQKRFIWSDDGKAANYDPQNRPRRQDWGGFLVENGAFYITSKEAILDSGCRISGRIDLYEMPEDSYFEIDTQEDWIVAEHLKYRQIRSQRSVMPSFQKIKLLICDVDGVLTDAGMYYGSDGNELKKYNTRDGMGIELLRKAGIKTMFLSSEESGIIVKRANKLSIDFLFMGVKDKLAFLNDFFQRQHDFSFETTAYIGDDVNDIAAMSNAFFSAAPLDAIEQVKQQSNYVCLAAGGTGCVREVCDLILGNSKHA